MQVLARQRRNLVFALSQIEARRLWAAPRIVTVPSTPSALFSRTTAAVPYYAGCEALRAPPPAIHALRGDRSLLRSIYGLPKEKLHVIPHGPTVPPRNGKPASPVKRPYVLCIAHASPTKNLDALVDAFGRITDRIREDLVIAGTGLDRSSLAALHGGNGAGRWSSAPTCRSRRRSRLVAPPCSSIRRSTGFGLPLRGPPPAAFHRHRQGRALRRCAPVPPYVDPATARGQASALYALLNDG
jgi:glycosyltransferase involved in cell wall biosynthesis